MTNKNIEEFFYDNFEKLLKNTNYEKNIDLFRLLYKYSKNKNTKNNISIKLLKEKTKWIPLFNIIKNRLTFINELYTDFSIKNKTTFNKFKDLYNNILKLLLQYFKIIESIEEDKYIDVNFLLFMNEENKLNIENIYSQIEETNRSITKTNILSLYHQKMIEKQKSKKETNKKDESKYDYALNQSNKYLVKFRRVSLKSFVKGSDKLEISKLFYDLRKITQVLILLKNTIKYYFDSKKYVVNKNLRSNLLTLIKVLQGTISRSNKYTNENENNSNENENNSNKKEKLRLKIRNRFKKRFLNNENDNNSNDNFNFVYGYKTEKNKQFGRNFRNKIRKNLELNDE